MKKTALLLILVFCSKQTLAQSWESDSSPNEINTPASTSKSTSWEDDANSDNNETADSDTPFEFSESKGSEQTSTRIRRRHVRRVSRPVAAPVRRTRQTARPQSPKPVKTAAAPVPAQRPQPRPTPAPAQALTPAPAKPVILPNSLLGVPSIYFSNAPTALGNQQGTLCTDPILCSARSYNQTPEKQARRLQEASTAIVTAAQTVHRNEPLPYANFISRFFRYGLIRSRKPMCAKAVRLILEHAGMIQKNSPFSPEGAKDYKTFLERFGFRDNKTACNSPGVVRVYGASTIPQCSRRNQGNCFRGRRMLGDRFGHVEILGSDHRFHHFTSSSESIQELINPNGHQRRPLVACMVKENWSK